jgi:hydroxymethylglutaryl-CoA lyase
MVDASDMCITTKEIDGIHNSVLVPNLNGFRKAEACGAEEIVAFFSASEIHNRKNVNRSVSESLEEIGQIAIASIKSGIIPRVNIATAFGYQKTESITDELIISFVKKLEAFGFVGITLCDTTGIAEPNRVYSLCHKIMTIQKKSKLAIHLHQSSGIEFASLYAAYKAGVTQFETAAGGLGGCPYALEADGNIPTETTVSLFNRMGLICDIDEDAIKVAANYAKQLQREYSKTE